MKILFFDTETTGLPLNYKAPAIDSTNWPRMIQFGYILSDSGRNVIEKGSFLIIPDGYVIPEAVSNIHHITTEKARTAGISLTEALNRIDALSSDVSLLVGHNVDFDIHVVDAEYYRVRKKLRLSNIPYICTMRSGAYFCGLPNNKWPKLSELYQRLFNKSFDDQHDAYSDTKAAFQCFWGLIDQNIISIGGSSEKSEVPIEIDDSEKSSYNPEILSKFKALSWFRNKLMQTNLNSTYEEQEEFLSQIFAQSEENAVKRDLSEFQRSFVDKIYDRSIEQHATLFEKCATKEDKFYHAIGIGMLDYVLGLSSSKEFRDKVIKNYFELLEEYLPLFAKYIIDNNRFDLTSSSENAFVFFYNLEKEHNAALDRLTNPMDTTKFIAPIFNQFAPKVNELRELGIDERVYAIVISNYFVGLLEGEAFLLRTIGSSSITIEGVNDADTLQHAITSCDCIRELVAFPEKEKQAFDKALETIKSFVPKKKRFRFW